MRLFFVSSKCALGEALAFWKIFRLVMSRAISPRWLWVAFVLGNDPTKRIIIISHGAELAVALANLFRMVVNSVDYKRLFPRMRVSRTKNTEYEVATTAGGFRLATTIDGAITGRHADIIIIDDPLKAADASSKNKREHVNEIYRNTIVSRLNDERTGAIVIVMQRLHVDDLCGYVLRGPDSCGFLDSSSHRNP